MHNKICGMASAQNTRSPHRFFIGTIPVRYSNPKNRWGHFPASFLPGSQAFMAKPIFILIMLVLAVIFVADASPLQSFKAGGTSIAIPPPREMVEVGYDNREFMEAFVPVNNRLIAGFVPADELPNLGNMTDGKTLSNYAMVQVPRRGENIDCGSDDFKEAVASIKGEFGDSESSTMKATEEEINRHIKSLELDKLDMTAGKMMPLGVFFEKTDSYGFGMLMPFSMGGTQFKMAMGGALLRVKQRLLFVYLYAEYKNEETVTRLRLETERWADAILHANK